MHHQNHAKKEDWLPSKEVAKRHNLVPDYVSRLARTGKVDGKKIDGVWYVNRNSFQAFRDNQASEKAKRSASIKEARKNEYAHDDATIYAKNNDVDRKAQPSTPLLPILKIATAVATFILLITTFTTGGVVLTHKAPHSEFANSQTAGVFSTIQDVSERMYHFVFGTDDEEDTRIAVEEPQTTESTTITTTTETTNTTVVTYATPTNPTFLTQTSTSGDLRLLRINARTYLRDILTVGSDADIEGDITAQTGTLSSLYAPYASISTLLAVNGTFTNLTVTNVTYLQGDTTVDGTLIARGGITTENADIDAGTGNIYANNLINSIVAGRNITIDNTDPRNPIISSRGGGGGGGGGTTIIEGSSG
ncbi:hypothetical protein N9089_04855, partial [Crocinitomicaceae bacterium]|nr:hypothetical protein [Crocinitomicaceae bacterium]